MTASLATYMTLLIILFSILLYMGIFDNNWMPILFIGSFFVLFMLVFLFFHFALGLPEK